MKERLLMNIKQYQELSARTLNGLEVQIDETEMRLANYALGLVGEAGEIAEQASQQAVSVDELGDCLWYVSAIFTVLDMEMRAVNSGNYDNFFIGKIANDLIHEASVVCEHVKKRVFHRKGDRTKEIVRHLGIMISMIEAMAGDNGLEVVMERNVEKLKSRYPDGFVLGGGVRGGGL